MITKDENEAMNSKVGKGHTRNTGLGRKVEMCTSPHNALVEGTGNGLGCANSHC